MGIEVGAVLDGKVTGITKFGAFVALPEGKSGLVHISEVANTFVQDVGEFLQVGQAVRVRVMNVAPDGKINLSVKRAEDGADPDRRPPKRPAPAAKPGCDARPSAPPQVRESAPQGAVAPPTDDSDFEDRLRRFMKDSDSRIADNRMYAERPRRNNRRGK